MIEVDGGSGEGGGQILRTAVALASVLGIDLSVKNIRAGRSSPGLQAQHLAGVRAASEICAATVKGAEIGSVNLEYRPSKPRGGRYSLDVGTAGSVTLVLQTLMPILAFAGGDADLDLTGGTDVRWSPPIDYLRLVALPVLSWMGYDGTLKLERRGYYPKGGGKIQFSSSPIGKLTPVNRTSPGRIIETEVLSYSTGLPGHVVERIASVAKELISTDGFPTPKVTLETKNPEEGPSTGCGVVLYGKTDRGALIGADGLGERGKPAEVVGAEAGKKMVEELRSGMFLDRHMGDMIVPYMALADGVSEVSVSQLTGHTLTNISVAESLAGVHFDIRGNLGGPGILRVKGCGSVRLAGSS